MGTLMPDSKRVDETDLMLLNALQIAPRASWTSLGQTLGLNPTTLARRWERLGAHGDAWISAYLSPTGSGGALVEVDCDANTAHSAAETLARDPRIATVEETSGARDLLLNVSTSSISALSDCLRGVQQAVGVRSVRSHVVTTVVTEASTWRLDALEPGQQLALRTRTAPGYSSSVDLDPLARRLAVELSADGRLPVSELAERTSASLNTVRRRLAHMEGAGLLKVRCDLAKGVSGSTTAATFWLSVPPRELDGAARAISELPQVRVSVGVTGPQNLIVIAWLRDTSDIPQFEIEMTQRSPAACIEDRAVTLRTIKHVGRLLDEQGCARGVVPVDPWAEVAW
ncbi:Lrp/AsnC family transcriptional regulator [Streptomyces sp. NPDC102279]|uniref:Lrp/AsnC family transcriptional regulator n=1 Tax=Streptomyces sp. NPDC102279 TaxID=3366153 RepID=UPI00380116C5